MKVLPWLIVKTGGPTVISMGICAPLPAVLVALTDNYLSLWMTPPDFRDVIENAAPRKGIGWVHGCPRVVTPHGRQGGGSG
jgi:hypothetical protein